MNKKNLLLVVFICLSTTVYGMNRGSGEDKEIPELPRMPREPRVPFNQMFIIQGGGKSGTPVSPDIRTALKHGFYGGVEQGTATVIVSLMVELTKLGIAKGVEWSQQPTKQELARLAKEMQLQELLEGLEKGIEKKQKLLAGNNTMITTVGQTVETAQKIFNKQLEQTKQELDTQIKQHNTLQTELFEQQKANEVKLFKEKLALEHEQKLLEFKHQHKIPDQSAPSPEQNQKLEIFIKTLEKETVTKTQQYAQERAKLYAEKLQSILQKNEQTKQHALKNLEAKNPEAKFVEMYDAYTDMALATLKEQRDMMDGTLIENVLAMLDGEKKVEAA